MDIRLLRFFIAVYEQQNVTRAAAQCFVSQPNISNGVKQLEEMMGTSLFERHKKGAIPNQEAHYLYPIAKRLVTEVQGLPNLFQQQVFQHQISIGIAESLAQEYKQQFFRTIHGFNDAIQWTVRTMDSSNDLNLLVREWKFETDLFLPLWKEPYVLCVPNTHPLIEKSRVCLEDLKGSHFIHCPPCEAHTQCLSILNSENSGMVTVANCSTKTETLTLLMAGVGITFLPESFVDGWYGFQVKPFDGPQYHREVGLSYPRQSLQNLAISQLIDYYSKYPLKTKKFSEFGTYK